MGYRLGVDVGGTFTDLLVIDEASGRTWRDKVPSTPHDPSEAVIAGVMRKCIGDVANRLRNDGRAADALRKALSVL